MSSNAAGRQLGKGKEYIAKVIEDIRKHINSEEVQIDSHVVLSDDWAKEILIQTGTQRSRLMLLGASDRNLPSRFFYGNAMEQILRKTPCDVGVYRKI
jgi:nucleotide-binding universal stress UspA family protein